MTEPTRQEPSKQDIRSQLDPLMPEPSREFNDWLRARLEAEQSERSGRPSSVERWALAAAVAAAVVLLSLAVNLLFRPGDSVRVAWADVMQAMENIRGFTASLTEEDGDRLRRIEAFYSRPGTWRVHLRFEDQKSVVFVTPRGSGLYDILKKTWGRRSDHLDPSLLPGGIATILQERGLLDALLHTFFQGDLPRGRPVRNAAESASGELEVFDFASDPGKTWARVWVLPRTRLPIRAKVFRPTSNEVTSVNFDYSDPQPEEFFDIGSFERAAKSAYVDRPFEVFRIGKQPLAGKPRTADQVFKIKGVVAPKIVRVVSNREGDILIQTDNPENRNVHGGRLSSIYSDDAHDNWGNLYVRVTGDRHGFLESGKELVYQYYSPVRPVNRGVGEQVLTLHYTAWNHHVGDKSKMGYDKALHVEKINVPAPTVDDAPEGWPGITQSNEKRDLAAAGYYEYAPTMEAIRALDVLLARDHASQRILARKLRVLEAMDATVGQAFFEEHLLEAARSKPIRNSHTRQLCAHAMKLDRAGRQDELTEWIAEISDNLETELGSMPPGAAKWWRERLPKELLSELLALPEVAREIRSGPRPEVVETVLTSGGYLLVTVEGDHLSPEDRPDGQQRYFYDGALEGSGWRKLTTFFQKQGTSKATGKTRRLVVLRGEGARAVILFSTRVNSKSNWAGAPMATIRQEIVVPEPSSITLDEYLDDHDNYATRGSWLEDPTPYEKARAEGSHLERLERFKLAIEAYRRALSLYEREDRNVDLDRAMSRSDTHTALSVAACLRKLGRLEQALEELESVEENAPEMPPGKYRTSWDFKAKILLERMAVAERYLEQGNRAAAQRLVDQTNALRPDYRRLSSLHQRFEQGFAGPSESTKERHRAYRQYLPVDRVMYRMSLPVRPGER